MFVRDAESDEYWVMQQARNVAMWMEEEDIRPHFILHDNDMKYTEQFDDFFRQVTSGSTSPRKFSKS